MVNDLLDRARGTQAARPRADGSPPVLWHLKVSHYNEKARWALDYKRPPHVRHAALPGRHARIARGLGAGRTFPVLELEGEVLGDSSLIIEALERRYPEPPLYPDDPEERRRALELEDFFDEELGPYLRFLVLEHMLPDPELLLGAFAPDLSPVRRVAARGMYPLLRRRTTGDFGSTPRASIARGASAGSRASASDPRSSPTAIWWAIASRSRTSRSPRCCHRSSPPPSSHIRNPNAAIPAWPICGACSTGMGPSNGRDGSTPITDRARWRLTRDDPRHRPRLHGRAGAVRTDRRPASAPEPGCPKCGGRVPLTAPRCKQCQYQFAPDGSEPRYTR